MQKCNGGVYWTFEEEQFLKKNYGKMTLEEISVTLGRSYPSVKHKAIRMHLSKSKKEYSKVIADRDEDPSIDICLSCPHPECRVSSHGSCLTLSKELRKRRNQK